VGALEKKETERFSSSVGPTHREKEREM
jgi:hypothetical protein